MDKAECVLRLDEILDKLEEKVVPAVDVPLWRILRVDLFDDLMYLIERL
jgi:hypothetical protein